MLKNLKRAAAIVLSFAMAIQFGLANSYYVNAEEVPLMVSAVTDGGWGWILDPWVNATQPNTVTRTDFVRK